MQSEVVGWEGEWGGVKWCDKWRGDNRGNTDWQEIRASLPRFSWTPRFPFAICCFRPIFDLVFYVIQSHSLTLTLLLFHKTITGSCDPISSSGWNWRRQSSVVLFIGAALVTVLRRRIRGTPSDVSQGLWGPPEEIPRRCLCLGSSEDFSFRLKTPPLHSLEDSKVFA